MKGKPKKRLRQTKAVAETSILDVAIRCFARLGFHNTSIQAIADACKVSQSAVLYHYKNKDQLIGAVLQKILLHNHSLVSKAMDEKDNPRYEVEKY